MARTRTKNAMADGGMAGLQMMPFPALNPWNWWALAAPQNAMRACAHFSQAALDAWRVNADGVTALMRAQQDMAMSLMRAPLAKQAEKEEAAQSPDAEAAAPSEDANAAAASFVAPMLEATRAYGRIGRAFIVAQRDTMRAFTQAEKPH